MQPDAPPSRARASRLWSLFVRQFHRPEGVLGRLAGWVMATRPSNVERSRWTIGLLNLSPGDRVLEIGCGPGRALEMCLATHPTVSAIGLDHSELMIEAARGRNRIAARRGRLHLVAGDLDVLAFVGRGATKCLLVNVFQFLPERADALRRIAGALAPGSTIAITFQPRKPGAQALDGLTFAETVVDAARQGGLRDAQIHELPLNPVPAFCVVARTAKPGEPL